jgi:triacylglycerol lipase
MIRQLKTVPDRDAPIDVWVDLVAHPEKNRSGYVNFEQGLEPDNRFESGASGFSRKNAWWLAEASFLSYWRDDEGVKRIYAESAGLQCVPLAEGPTQCHLAFNDDFAIVAFRGTQSDDWRDLFDDARFKLTDWQTGHVHAGFKGAFDRIRDKLNAALTTHAPNRPVWMTGHSLGAALAVLAADEIEATQGVYTFGLPRVGDPTFVAHFNERFRDRSFRYVDHLDVVTHVPPEKSPLGSYSHVDERRWIDKDGNVSTATPTLPHFVQAVFGRPIVLFHTLQLLMQGRQPSMLDALADHAPVLYTTHTWNDLVRNP